MLQQFCWRAAGGDIMVGFEQITDRAQTARGDCLELLREIPDGSVDMVLTDLPYGTTSAPWDIRIDEFALFREFWRVDKGNAAVLLFGQFPFACDLIMAARNRYRYKWVWKKGNMSTGFLNAHKMPLRNHEDILVFYQALPVYNPQFDYRGSVSRKIRNGTKTALYRPLPGTTTWECPPDGRRMPMDVVSFPIEKGGHVTSYHNAQKPIELLRYLIRTYTNPGDVVLDCTMGSGSTGVAAEMEKRRFIGIELDEGFYETAKRRIEDAARQPGLFDSAPCQTVGKPVQQNLEICT